MFPAQTADLILTISNITLHTYSRPHDPPWG